MEGQIRIICVSGRSISEMAERPPRGELAVEADGPLAVWLDSVLKSTGLVDGMRLDRREDRGEGPWTGGSVQYLSTEGGYVNATVQRLLRPLDDAVFTYGGQCQIELWASGTEAVLREIDPRPSGFAQVILRRPDAVMAQVTAGGPLGRSVVRPLSREQVRQLGEELDSVLTDRPPKWPTKA